MWPVLVTMSGAPRDSRPILALTLGDPTGIGPEIAVAAVHDPGAQALARIVIIGDRAALAREYHRRGIAPLPEVPSLTAPAPAYPCALCLSGLAPAAIAYGRPNPEAGRAQGAYVEAAIRAALAGHVQGIVTAPIHKKSFNEGGWQYPGHTEMVAHLTGTADFAMLLAGGSLRVVPVTIHVPLREVAARLTTPGILRAIQVAHRGLRDDFGIAAPRLAVMALNPHAGEKGAFGGEEGAVIEPAIAQARALDIDARGPLPADGGFPQAITGHYDACIAMYHDQGLVAIKVHAFGRAANITLGTPIIRTSVDHGTAHDIAGQGVADYGSLLEAIRVAVEIHTRRSATSKNVSRETLGSGG